MTLRSPALAAVTIVLFIGGIALSMALNLWKTESSKIPVTIRSGEFAGSYDPGDIRGSYTLEDVASAFDVPVATLAEAFAVTGIDDPAAFKVNELEGMYQTQEDGGEIGTDSVRLFVSRYTGIPYEAEETTRLPSPAVALLKDRVSEQAYADLGPAAVPVAPLKSIDGTEGDAAEADTTIKGKTTFDELLSWGLTKEEIESILETPIGARSEAVRDFLANFGLEFADYRDRLQVLVDTRTGGVKR